MARMGPFFLESTQKIVQTSVRAFVCKGAIGLHSKFQNMITLHDRENEIMMPQITSMSTSTTSLGFS